ncbi:signal peptidase I [Cellulomonas sp. SG140]|uniref:signal peptidase I n=1 Tax=Cellulomonas sp. SG140 TaxID=2976536 RepID=UPI0021E8FE6C|nr:signal peptidase I [Cellulomonas sp. SG140]
MTDWRSDSPQPAQGRPWSTTPAPVPPSIPPADHEAVPPATDRAESRLPRDEVVPSRRQRRAPAPHRGGAFAWLRETVVILASALVLSLLVKTFLVQAFYIPSPSMHETLIENDRILVSKLVPGPLSLHRGDIVVFKDPGGWLESQPVVTRSGWQRTVNDVLTWVGLLPVDAGEHLVKRVIGLPGDHVTSAGNGAPVMVNGVALKEPYVAPGSQPSSMAFDVVVPPSSLWVMGDNRDHSSDSRYHQGNPGGGSVPEANVVGVAFVIVWPLQRVTVLHNPSATFAGVPNP